MADNRPVKWKTEMNKRRSASDSFSARRVRGEGEGIRPKSEQELEEKQIGKHKKVVKVTEKGHKMHKLTRVNGR